MYQDMGLIIFFNEICKLINKIKYLLHGYFKDLSHTTVGKNLVSDLLYPCEKTTLLHYTRFVVLSEVSLHQIRWKVTKKPCD